MTGPIASLKNLAANVVNRNQLDTGSLPQDLVGYLQHVLDLATIQNEPSELHAALHALGTAIINLPAEDYRDPQVRGGLAAQAEQLAERARQVLALIRQAMVHISAESDEEWRNYYTAVCASASLTVTTVQNEAELLWRDLQTDVSDEESDDEEGHDGADGRDEEGGNGRMDTVD